MSRESDKEYKPTTQQLRTFTAARNTRPARLRRRPAQYDDLVNITESDGETDIPSSKGAVNSASERTPRSRQVLRASSIESVWGSSDTSDTFSCWSPETFNRKTATLVTSVEEVKTQFSRMAKDQEEKGMMEKMLEMLITSRAEDQRLERQRRDEQARIEQQRREDEAARRAEDLERQERWIKAIQDGQAAVPQTVHLDTTKLPSMVQGEDIEIFIDLFETALRVGKMPEDKWVAKLHSALDTETKLSIKDTISDPLATYKEIKQALIGQSFLTFTAASEAIMTLDQGSITRLPMKQAVRKLTHLFEKATAEATNVREACIYSAVAVARYALTADAKMYMDIKGTFDGDGFCRSLDEWQKTHPGRQVWDHKARQPLERTPSRVPGRRSGSCFHCGKPGHFASECRTRLAGGKPAYQQQEGAPPPSQPFFNRQDLPAPVSLRPEVLKPARGERDMSKVTCFYCRQQGHISTTCPKKTAAKVKKVKVREDLVERLRTNEVFGAVGPYRMPVTCDTGADITVVPEEAVEPEEFMGETCELRSFNDGQSVGKRCVMTISAGNHTFTREAVTQPGKALGWSVCLSLNLADSKDRTFLTEQIAERDSLTEKDILYIPPEVRNGFLISGIPVKEAHVVKGVRQKPVATEEVPLLAAEAEALEPEKCVSSEAPEVQQVLDTESVVSQEDEEDRVAVEGGSLVDGEVLEQVEDSGVTLEGSAESEGTLDIPVDKIRERMSLAEMIDETKSDSTLATIVKLAELERDGYHMSQGLAFRTRLDTFGQPVEQLCVPTSFRKQCLEAAHTSFGHQGRNRMVALLRPHFYWPCMTRDCVTYIRSCDTCQVMDRTLPKPPVMTEREVVTKPFSDVAVDIVGPFPTAKGGFRFMMTCIDTASRWPEAFPLRSTTSRAVIVCLMQVFTRWGFPEKLTSDNGPQFTSATFAKWLRDKGIAHARATPYHPQANGIVERLHRTLNSVIAKTVACKGDWAAVLPMVLFFLRCTPTRSTRISPFLLTHGWEPPNPIQLLYKSWVDRELGGVDLSEWVLDNSGERKRAGNFETS